MKYQVAQNLLSELAAHGKIDEDTLDVYRTKVKRIMDAIDQSSTNVNKLMLKSSELKGRVGKENNTFEVADQVKNEHAKIYKRLQEAAKKAKDEGYVQQDKLDALHEKYSTTSDNLDAKKKELGKLQDDLAADIKQIEDKFQAHINQAVKDAEALVNLAQKAKSEEEAGEIEKAKLVGSCAEHREQVEKLEDEISKIREEPARLEYKNVT